MTGAELATVAHVDAILAEIRAVRAELAELRAARPARLVSVADAARELGISKCSVRRRITDGSLPSRRLGSRVLVNMTAAQSVSDEQIARMAREARG